MIYKIDYIKDVLNNNYIGIKFNSQQMSNYLKTLEHIIDDSNKYNTLINNQQKRDKRDDIAYHCTILSVMEFNKLYNKLGNKLQDRLDIIFSLDITDLKFEGIGTAKRNENETYFVVIDSPTLDEIRSSLGLEPRDFHITIGFDKKDVFGVRKNKPMEIESRLVKIYKKKMEEYDSYEWLYNIKNFNNNLKQIPADKIELINITPSTINVRMDHTLIQIGYINDELRISSESEIKK